MPRPRPRQMAETGYHEQPTRWFVVASNRDPHTAFKLRIFLPAGGRHKATLLGEFEVAPGTASEVLPGHGATFELAANHQLYATVDPPLKTAGVRLECLTTKPLPIR